MNTKGHPIDLADTLDPGQIEPITDDTPDPRRHPWLRDLPVAGVIAVLLGGLAAIGVTATAVTAPGGHAPPQIITGAPRVPGPPLPALTPPAQLPRRVPAGPVPVLPGIPFLAPAAPAGLMPVTRPAVTHRPPAVRRAPVRSKPPPPVLPPPVVTSPGSQTGVTGTAVSLQLSTSPAEPVTWQAQLPPGLAISTAGLISGTLTTAGTYQCAAAATDAHGQTGGTGWTWTVTTPPPVVTVTSPGDQTSGQGDTVSLPVTAADSAGGTLTYTAAGLPPGLGIDPAAGLISGALTTPGTYAVTVTATDAAGSSGQAAWTWTVLAATPPPPSPSPTGT
jgi:Putative Ig domain